MEGTLRTCDLDGCSVTFAPKSRKHRFCCDEHRRLDENNLRKHMRQEWGPIISPAEELLIAQVEATGRSVLIIPQKDDFDSNTYKEAVKREKGHMCFGVVSDTHIGSIYQQLTHLHHFYKYAKERGAKRVFHAGDEFDARHVFKGQEHEVFLHSFESQVNYAAKNHPGDLPTVIIGGNHDEDWIKHGSGDPLAELAAKRRDIDYRGFYACLCEVGPLRFTLRHPDGSSSRVSRSLKLQGEIERYLGRHSPHMFFMGHYHHTCHLPQFRGVMGWQLACFQSETYFLRRKGAKPEIMGLIIDAYYGSAGLTRVVFEEVWFPTAVDHDF